MFKIDKKRIVIYIAVVGLLIFLYFLGILQPINNVITSILNPIFSEFHTASSDLRIAYNERADKKDWHQTIEELEVRANQLTEENVKLKTAEEENKILRVKKRFFISRMSMLMTVG